MKSILLKPIALPWMLLLFFFTQAGARQILIPQLDYHAAHEKLTAGISRRGVKFDDHGK